MRADGRFVTVLAALLLCSCGGGSQAVGPAQLIHDAKHSIDATTSVHFTLVSQNVAGSTGPLITGGEGDARRPDSFTGSLSIVVAGFTVTVNIVSIAGVFYAQTPLSTGYTRTNPAAYGFGDPAQLVDPNHGLSSLLTACSGATLQASDRLRGEQLDEVGCSMPGKLVARLLTSADASQSVQATVGVDHGNHQLRRVTLVGPFFARSHRSTFTVVLDRYGENVTITPPAA